MIPSNLMLPEGRQVFFVSAEGGQKSKPVSIESLLKAMGNGVDGFLDLVADSTLWWLELGSRGREFKVTHDSGLIDVTVFCRQPVKIPPQTTTMSDWVKGFGTKGGNLPYEILITGDALDPASAQMTETLNAGLRAFIAQVKTEENWEVFLRADGSDAEFIYRYGLGKVRFGTRPSAEVDALGSTTPPTSRADASRDRESQARTDESRADRAQGDGG